MAEATEKKKGHHETTKGISTDWRTPGWLLEMFGPFDLDPCPAGRTAKQRSRVAPNYITPAQDATAPTTGWAEFIPGYEKKPGPFLAWMNPPFGEHNCPPFLERAAMLANLTDINTLAIIPARVETKYFHKWVFGRASLVLIPSKRIQYADAKGNEVPGVGFPSCIVAFGDYAAQRLAQRGKKLGRLVWGWS